MRKIFFIILILCMILSTSCTPSAATGIQELESIDQFYDVIADNDVSYIYFGRPTCPDCNDFFIILEEVVMQNSHLVYYFNTDERKEERDYDDIIEIFRVDWVPSLYKVQNNVIIDAFPLKFERQPSPKQKTECKDALTRFFKNS